jgi:peptidoglycan/xylan/chitin deacetylase (PgdA/CDA1 family)
MKSLFLYHTNTLRTFLLSVLFVIFSFLIAATVAPSKGNAQTQDFQVLKSIKKSEPKSRYGESVRLQGDEIATFRISIVNFSNKVQNVTITDDIGTPHNGGRLDIIPGSIKITCHSSVTCSYSSKDDLFKSGIQVKNLPTMSGGSASRIEITYDVTTGSRDGIPPGGVSYITNTVKLSNGQSDVAMVEIVGEDLIAADLRVITSVSSDKKTYDKRVTINNDETIYYKVIVSNVGERKGGAYLSNNEIIPQGNLVAVSESESITCAAEFCTGSIFEEGIDIKNLEPGKQVELVYERKASIKNLPQGKNIKITDRTELSTHSFSDILVTVLGTEEDDTETTFGFGKVVSPDKKTYSENITRKNGESAFFKVVVINTGSTDGSVTVTDTVGQPTNGGSLTPKLNSESIACRAEKCEGSLLSGGLTITNLPPGKSVVIYYESTANTNGIPVGKISKVTNTAALSNGIKNTASVTLISNKTSQENLVKNGSYEEIPKYWNNFQGGYTRVSGGHTGSWSIEVTKTTPSGSAGAYQRVDLNQTSKKPVFIGGYIKGKNIKNTTNSFLGASIYVEIHLQSGKVVYWNSLRNEGTFDWRWIGFNTGTLSTVNEPIDYVYIVPIINGSTGTAYFDDIFVKEFTPQSPAITIMFDDGEDNTYTIAKPILDAYNFVGTTSIITDRIGDERFMSLEQIKNLEKKGWDIISHGVSHVDLTRLSDDKMESELRDSKKILQNHGFTVNNFAFPYGAYNAKVLATAQKYYDSARLYEQNANPYGAFPFDMKVRGTKGNTTISDVSTWINEAKREKKWIIIVFHSIVEEGDDDYYTQPDMFRKIIKEIADSGVQVITYGEGIQTIAQAR